MAGTAILCARCHSSEALPGSGVAGLSPLTRAMHSKHANVVSPSNGLTLESVANRSSCYQCHPGSDTRCLRGAMGAAVAKDGTMEMQCQSCHGSMSKVGSASRTGWLDEAQCGNCHTGTASRNNGTHPLPHRVRYQWPTPPACERDVCHQSGYTNGRQVLVPLLEGPRRHAVLRLSWFHPCRVPFVASQ